MAVEWYYTTNKQQMGPVSWMDLRELADHGILKPHDMVWTEGMDEWVKAIQKGGLFADGAQSGRSSSAKPPPGRRVRREDEDENEDDERTSRKKAKKRVLERTKMTTGLKVGLILGGVLCGLLLLGCAGGLMIWAAFRGNAGRRPQPAPNFVFAPPQPAPNFMPAPPRTQTYTVNNLMPDPIGGHGKLFIFQQGQRVIITVTNTLADPKTDVDLYVHPTNNMAAIIAVDLNTPDINRNCRVEFIVPATQSYTVRLVNLGPGVANTCQVTIEER